ncbi:MAG: glycoside hydrolase family 19 protein [Sphingomonas sp.]|jgi:putative chitinase|uniref:glycoside hydrolase family 19 protein n=1 Tax=Sphingomonas sp. TaxID=28214 RepID=UPI003569D4BF
MAKRPPSCDAQLAREQMRQDVDEWANIDSFRVRTPSRVWRTLLKDAGLKSGQLFHGVRGERGRFPNPDAAQQLLEQIDNANDAQVCTYDRERSYAIEHDFWGVEDSMVEGEPRRRRGLGSSGGGRPWYLQWWLWASLAAGSYAIFKGRSLVGGDSNMTTTTPSTPPTVQSGLISLDQLRKIMPRIPTGKAQIYLSYLNGAMEKWGITSARSIAAFLANVALETGELIYLSEIWGPSEAQLRYEGTKTIPRLGNTQPGDGFKFRGRGALQLTGRAAYREAGTALNMDLEGNPDSVSSNPVAIFGTAGWYWSSHKLTPWADAGDFDAVVRGINCGNPTSTCTPYHLDKRREYYQKALAALGA